jgi:hypothetical protein
LNKNENIYIQILSSNIIGSKPEISVQARAKGVRAELKPTVGVRSEQISILSAVFTALTGILLSLIVLTFVRGRFINVLTQYEVLTQKYIENDLHSEYEKIRDKKNITYREAIQMLYESHQKETKENKGKISKVISEIAEMKIIASESRKFAKIVHEKSAE